jgi:hypothetical protein
MRPSLRKTVLKRAGLARPCGSDRPQAAAELVRLEYERERLLRALEALNERRSTAMDEMAAVEDRIHAVQTMLLLNARQPSAHGPAPMPKPTPVPNARHRSDRR